MIIQLNIEDKALLEKISLYVGDKHKEINEQIIEVLEKFFEKKEPILKYDIEDIDKNASVIDFGLDDEKIDKDIKLFEDVENVADYSKKLRDNAWK